MSQSVSRNIDNGIMFEILQEFCARARNITGSEETYRAILVHQLLEFGIQFNDIIAEYPVNSGRIDIAIMSRKEGEERISHLIEIKGGAYGNRHALHDELKPGLETKDLKKLGEAGDEKSKRWFIALDISSIKGAIEEEARSWVASECNCRNINFVYCDFSKLEMEAQVSGKRLVLEVEDQTPNYRMNPEASAILDSDSFWESVSKVSSSEVMHEQNEVLGIYEALMMHDFPEYAVSLETQFEFAKGRTKNGKNRPDICIFDPTINGKFNLYAQGKAAQSRDALKLMKLQSLIEVKVSPSIDDALADIQKLAGWRSQMLSRAADLGVEMHDKVRYMFVAANLDHSLLSEVLKFSQEMNINTRIL